MTEMRTAAISIQNQVLHGQVGNNAAVLPMQASGLNVAAVPTTLPSNHLAEQPRPTGPVRLFLHGWRPAHWNEAFRRCGR